MTSYPVKLEARLDPAVSRWLWLVKWLLAIPHYLVLVFLWLAFAGLTVVAFFAILFTGRYPRPLFEFNVGVLRWTWRVGYYAYSALGTDRYPPFTLDDVPDYPARLEIEYPGRLSNGLVLVKWLLVVPHLLVLAVLLGGGPYLSYRLGDSGGIIQGGGLLGLLVLIAGFVLLFTGRYPRDLYDLIVGLNRWVYRVAGYAMLMTDRYPPFRLDTGGDDPAGALTFPVTGTAVGESPRPSGSTSPEVTAAAGSARAAGEPGTAYPAPGMATYAEPRPVRRWTPGRVISVVLGTLLIAAGFGSVATGVVALWFDQTARDSDGLLRTDPHEFSTASYALATEPGALRFDGPDWLMGRILGDVSVTGTSTTGTPLFIGIAPAQRAGAYLAPIEHATISDVNGNPPSPSYRLHDGQAPDTRPGDQPFWVASAAGTGQQVVRWQARTGDWTVVVMNADGSRAVQADLAVAATLPWLNDAAFWLIGVGLVLLLGGALLISLALRHQEPARTPVS
jgi:hypothetical protein